jgi:hypothetical protein
MTEFRLELALQFAARAADGGMPVLRACAVAEAVYALPSGAVLVAWTRSLLMRAMLA